MKYLLFFSTLLAVSCNFSPKPIDIDIPEPPQKLVVSSWLVPPQEAAITLTRTFSALVADSTFNPLDTTGQNSIASKIFVENGLVSIENRGNIAQFYQLLPGVYGSADVPQHFGDTYVLRATDPLTGEEIEAETQLMPQVSIDTVYAVRNTSPGIGGDSVYGFELKFRDIPQQTNYYLITYTDFANAASSINGLNNTMFSQTGNTFNVIADAQYEDGKEILFKSGLTEQKGDTLLVGFSQITKGYYEFLSAYKRTGNILSQLTGEPINLPTNVKNGYGYFAMIRPKPWVVVME